eukprot:CAMPEP_0197025242 /NCGR_PEP_ID=MMETSP1384-20130603/5641_1 /TAXON_ID=29189 /ORGANISM="Ammonia sp." /LENGTH=200 /DNA_ID=CAMNT_0042453755 /DNA_START=20 /DNA_END=619 /DNA_ORIENTATION=+
MSTLQVQNTASVLHLTPGKLFQGLDVDKLPIGRTSKYIAYLDHYNVPQFIILYFFIRDLYLVRRREQNFMKYKQQLDEITPTTLLLKNLANNVRFLGMNLCLKYMMIGLFRLRDPNLITPRIIDNCNYFALVSYVFVNVADLILFYLQENEYDVADDKLVEYYLQIKKLSYLFKTSFFSLTISIWICVRYYEYLYKAIMW